MSHRDGGQKKKIDDRKRRQTDDSSALISEQNKKIKDVNNITEQALKKCKSDAMEEGEMKNDKDQNPLCDKSKETILENMVTKSNEEMNDKNNIKESHDSKRSLTEDDLSKTVGKSLKNFENLKKKKYVVDEELLLAFRYFDRSGCGYIKCDDLKRLLHNLGYYLSPKTVRELVYAVADKGKYKHERVYYRDITDKEYSI